MQIQKINTQSFKAKSIFIDPAGLMNQEQLTILSEKGGKVGSPSDVIQAQIATIPGINLIKKLHAIKVSTLINNKADEFFYYFAETSSSISNIMKFLAVKNNRLESNSSFEYSSNSEIKQMPFFELLSEFIDKLAEKYPAN